MILPSRRALPWILVSLGLLGGLVATYVLFADRSAGVPGSTPWGIGYGVGATALVLLLMGFGIRKRAYKSTWGTLDGWLQAHIYLGLLSVVVVLLHAGFRFEDKIATATFAALVAVVATGFLGARLYASLPRALTREQTNLPAEEISEELNRLRRSMAQLAAGRSALFSRLAERLLAEGKPRSAAGWRLLFGAGKTAGEERDLEPLVAQLPEDEREPLRQLFVGSRRHRELHGRLKRQQRIKNLLEVWLYLHLPLSFALLVLLAVHIVAAFYFGAI